MDMSFDIYDYLVFTAQLISRSYFKDKFVFKGASVLVSKLIQYEREDLYRITRDLDIHCSSKEIWVEFCDMVRYNRHEFHLFETLLSAFDESKCDKKRLKRPAKGYKIWGRMKKLYKEALKTEGEG